MANSNLMILFMLLIFGYFVLYFGGRKYLEKFENDYDGQSRFNPDGTPRTETGRIMNKHQKGNYIDDIQTALLQKIDYVTKINSDGFKNFHNQGNTQAVQNMTKGFGYEPSFNFFKK